MKLFIFLFFFSASLFAADINSSIVKGDSQYYKSLLQHISKYTDSQSEASLQKTLLLQLMSEEKKSIENYNIPQFVSTQQEYKKLFELYIKSLLSIKKLQQSIEANQAKIDTLAAQIKEQDKMLLTTQLFYAFYTKQQKIENLKVENINQALTKIKTSLINSLKEINFDKGVVLNNLKKLTLH
jgi:hypothetical protein